MTGSPSVTILFVVKNERVHLEETLPRIAAQTYSGAVEIVAVDSGSEDGTPDLLREHGARVIDITPEEFHHATTRNFAAEHAQNDILILLSGDAVPLDNEWLSALVTPFTDPDVAAVYGRQVPPSRVGAVRKRYLAGEYPETKQFRKKTETESIHAGLFRFSNANGAIRREDWARFRWNEKILLAEDIGMCRDLFMVGRAIVYEPKAAVRHGHSRGLVDEFRYAFDNGYSLRQINILGNPEIAGMSRIALRRALNDLKHFAGRGRIDLAVYAGMVYAAKWLGVQFGKRGDGLPKPLLRHMSETLRRRKKWGLD